MGKLKLRPKKKTFRNEHVCTGVGPFNGGGGGGGVHLLPTNRKTDNENGKIS